MVAVGIKGGKNMTPFEIITASIEAMANALVRILDEHGEDIVTFASGEYCERECEHGDDFEKYGECHHFSDGCPSYEDALIWWLSQEVKE